MVWYGADNDALFVYLRPSSLRVCPSLCGMFPSFLGPCGCPALTLATFVPPDVEDPPTPVDLAEPMELEEEDMEWQKWLNDLFNPSSKEVWSE